MDALTDSHLQTFFKEVVNTSQIQELYIKIGTYPHQLIGKNEHRTGFRIKIEELSLFLREGIISVIHKNERVTFMTNNYDPHCPENRIDNPSYNLLEK